MTQKQLKDLYLIVNQESSRRQENGEFGINACKESIKFARDVMKKSYWSQLVEFIDKANNDIFFNRAMVLACWELIGEEEE